MMVRLTRVGLLIALLLAAGAVQAATRADVPGLTQWLPEESCAGGAQADAHLDQPVQYWRAGVPLGEVLADLQRQTGVTLRFLPNDSENPRVPVNVFLNKEHPPTLRDVMDQLTWIVDCPFLLEEEGGARVYVLASTSVSDAVSATRRARREATREEREALWKGMEGRLEEYRQALELSRAELVRTYRGRDDLLLLNLLDPTRRTVTELTLRLLDRHRPEVWPVSAEADTDMWSAESSLGPLTPVEVADLGAAWGLPERAVRDIRARALVSVGAGGGEIVLEPAPVVMGRAPGTSARRRSLRLLALSAQARLTGQEHVQLMRALGEPVGDAGTAAGLARRWDQESEARARRAAETREQEGHVLSPRFRARLAALSLPFPSDAYAPLWQLQEGLAKALSCHVVSDALRTGGLRASALSSGTEGPPLGLANGLEGAFHYSDDHELQTPLYEWTDAGDFLRFRTTDRALFRAAMLPEWFTAWVDSRVRPYAPADKAARSAEFVLPTDLRLWVRQLARLSDVQLDFGHLVNTAAPDSLVEQARQQVLQTVLPSTRRYHDLLRFLALLGEADWRALVGAGFMVHQDPRAARAMQTQPMRLLQAWADAQGGADTRPLSAVSLRIADRPEPAAPRWTASDPNPASWLRRGIWREGDNRRGEWWEAFLPRQVKVAVKLPEPAETEGPASPRP